MKQNSGLYRIRKKEESGAGIPASVSVLIVLFGIVLYSIVLLN